MAKPLRKISRPIVPAVTQVIVGPVANTAEEPRPRLLDLIQVLVKAQEGEMLLHVAPTSSESGFYRIHP